MRIKKFVANSMPEAMKQIKEQLGNDAIILNSKEIKPSGLLGLFRRKKIEVTAMLDEDIRHKPQPRINNGRTSQPIISKEKKLDEQRILDEIKHLQSILTTKTFQSDHNFPPILESIYQYLIEQEVTKEIAKEIVSSMVDSHEHNLMTRETTEKILREKLEKQFAKMSFHGINENSKVVQFVGPTGVGKTTTLAKVAANSMLKEKNSVAFITADTYRIAAIEQLKTYAKILDVPLEVVYSQQDYKDALNKFSQYDRIFVDTAGRNFRENHYLNELKQLINTPSYPTQTFLVLALTAKATDISEIFARFKPLGIEQVIFTKLDETESYGSLLNLSIQEYINIAYVTNGQNVPDDLLIPNEKMITDIMLRRYKDV